MAAGPIGVTERRAGKRVAGLCRLCDQPVVPGGRTCERHRRDSREHSRALYLRRRAAGLCGGCGKSEPARNRTLCISCLDRSREASRGRRRARGADPTAHGCGYCREPGHSAIACPSLRALVSPATITAPTSVRAGRGRLLYQILTTLRLLALGPLTITELSRQCGVAWRTGYRLIEQLLTAGAPIVADAPVRRDPKGRGAAAKTFRADRDAIRKFLCLEDR